MVKFGMRISLLEWWPNEEGSYGKLVLCALLDCFLK